MIHRIEIFNASIFVDWGFFFKKSVYCVTSNHNEIKELAMNQLLKILLVAFMVSLIGCSNTIEPTDTMNGVENSASISKGNVDNDTFFSQDDDDSCGEGKERQMIDCLGLSESQKAALNALKIENNNACKSAKEKFDAAKKNALKTLLSEQAKCNASAKNDSEKRSIYERLKKIYNEATTKAEAAYKSSLKNHNKKFYDAFCTILTAEQIAKLNLWLSGKNPCDTTNTGGTGSGDTGSGTIGSGGTGSGDTGSGGTGTGIGTGG
jgi:Spy/CpxP family protein refolding chaperone